MGYRKAQNYLLPQSQYSFEDYVQLHTRGLSKHQYYNHMSAGEIKDLLGDEVWNSYYKFCFERNPWDRVISFYYWRYQSTPRPTMLSFLLSDAPLKLKRFGYDLYTIDRNIAVDDIYCYEDLKEAAETIRKRLKLPGKLLLPRAKSGYRKDTRHYSDIFSLREKQIISDLFSEEITLFGYQF
ncbi:chondroitin 4-O-sulfotransferase [Oleiphilus messinensis]|uniref:Chondroitin 4-O-sulfotransferase n=2 Tax=Oleiphilus messinensis TaxID=141451 RepID=A0A1Y0IEB0_9GAMM|nr:chondroitin 4-O-sulfotransferase [Oleiphilus messinensis]